MPTKGTPPRTIRVEDALWSAWAVRGGLSPEGIVRNILEAAAPHLLAEAKRQRADAMDRVDERLYPNSRQSELIAPIGELIDRKKILTAEQIREVFNP